ncbi:MAG: RDD family protein [Chitinophagaceae bacterium]|nr:RDD family protein [Chitinophagaceae bacterium]
MTEIANAKYQTFFKRLAATIIDTIIFLPVLFLSNELFGPNPEKSIGWQIVQNGLYYSYSIIGHALYGQTIGKRLTSIKVVQNENESILLSFFQSFMRDSIGVTIFLMQIFILVFNYGDTPIGEQIISLSTLVWIIAEMVTMLFNSKRRSIHDYIAKSVVIKLKVSSKRTVQNN